RRRGHRGRAPGVRRDGRRRHPRTAATAWHRVRSEACIAARCGRGTVVSELPAPLEQRLVDLESRLAFQEVALAEMSDALAAARDESARNAEMLRRALDDLRQLRTLLYADPTQEPPPPHW